MASGFSRTGRLKSWGIRERVIFVAVVPATFIAVILAANFLLVRYADAERGLIDRGHSLIKLLIPAAEYGVFSGNREELHQLAAALARTPDMKAVAIYNHGGTPLAQVGTLSLSLDPQQLADGWSDNGKDGEIQTFHAKIRRPTLSMNDPLTWVGNTPSGGESIGSITLELSRADVLARKREMMVATLIATLATLTLAVLLALRLAGDVSAPILALQRVVASIRRGHLESRAAHHPARTLRGLEDGINEMATALQAGRDLLESRIAKATAELQQKKDEAEQASIAKSRFLAATSHDLRQPLHALALFSTNLADKADTPSLRRLSGQINAAVGSLGELLDGLLDISRIDLGATQPDLQPVILDELLERVVATHSSSAETKGLRLRRRPTRLLVLSDPRLLFRMVSNLVANAVRYTERGGILVGVRRAADKVRIEVWDTGIGIATEQQTLVFREFFQAANPERDPGKGLGLGLSLVERLAQLLDHPVSLRSIPNSGSVFGIALPRCATVSAVPGANRPAAPGSLNARLLFFGEDQESGNNLCRLLATWGCQVTLVQAATDAARLPATPPDLMLCENNALHLALPFVRHLIASGSHPALILIGESVVKEPPELDGAHVVHLSAPVQPAKLRALMHHLLDEEMQIPAEARSAA